MQAGIQQLSQDLDYLQAMVRDLDAYLDSNVHFWPSLKAGFPDLTLGGYVMRQRRLQILAYLLSAAEQAELKQIALQFKNLANDRAAALEQKATGELAIRINQWEQDLQEYRDSEEIEKEYYRTDAQIRTIITDLIVWLGMPPHQLDQALVSRLDRLDEELHRNWQIGDFIWPAEWIPAYGMRDYWFLYGMPVAKDSIFG